MFEHLDDRDPPSPNADRKRAVLEGVARRRRVRVQRAAAVAAVSAVTIVGGTTWAMASRDTTSVVTADSTDPLSFCTAAQQIQSDHQHATISGHRVVIPNFEADYAALTDAATDPQLQQALHDAAGLLAAPLRPLTPLETHSARIVQEALVARCDLSTTIFGLIVNRTSVTLPAPATPATPTANDQNTFQFALIGFTEAEADRVAEQSGWTIRVVERDSAAIPATADRVSNRIDVAVQDGIVVAVAGFY